MQLKYSFLAGLLLFGGLPAFAAQFDPPQVRTEMLADDVEINFGVYPATGNYVGVWLASGFGFHPGHNRIAHLLSKKGMEIWQLDLLDALFLPKNSTSMRNLSGTYISEIISLIIQVTKKKVVLISNGYGAVPLLHGARVWQQQDRPAQGLVGVILFSPSLYLTVPSLGLEPEFLPITYSSSIPILLFQGEKLGNRWQLPLLIEQLSKGGSAVYSEIMSNVISLFYRKDLSEAEERYFKILPAKILSTLPLLEQAQIAQTQRSTDIKEIQITSTFERSGIDTQLIPYKGAPNPLPLHLSDVNGKYYDKKDYQGKITIINFWATWCPPCVTEIPSLNRLIKINKNIDLISINYAEDASVIKKFMQEVNVEFPVLLDTDGKVSASWKVFAFPSTFVIGPDGKIQYGVNAAIHWDDDSVIKKLNALQPLAK